MGVIGVGRACARDALAWGFFLLQPHGMTFQDLEQREPHGRKRALCWESSFQDPQNRKGQYFLLRKIREKQ